MIRKSFPPHVDSATGMQLCWGILQYAGEEKNSRAFSSRAENVVLRTPTLSFRLVTSVSPKMYSSKKICNSKKSAVQFTSLLCDDQRMLKADSSRNYRCRYEIKGEMQPGFEFYEITELVYPSVTQI